MEGIRRAWKSYNDPLSCHSPAVVRAGAACVFVISCLETVQLLFLCKSFDHYEDIIHMIDVDWQFANGRKYFGFMGIRLLAVISIFATTFSMVLGGMGYLAHMKRSATGICIYFVGVVGMAIFFFALCTQAFTFSTILEPVVKRQAEEFCNATLHWTYSNSLGCSISNERAALPAGLKLDDCGVDCSARLSLLRRMGGCTLLEKLCHDYNYEGVGTGFCLIEKKGGSQVRPPVVASEAGQRVAESCCRRACNTRVACTGYSYNDRKEACSLLSPRHPKSWYLRKKEQEQEEEEESSHAKQPKKPEKRHEERRLLDPLASMTEEGSLPPPQVPPGGPPEAPPGAPPAAPHGQPEGGSKEASKGETGQDNATTGNAGEDGAHAEAPLDCGLVRWAPKVTNWPDKVPLSISGVDGTPGVRCGRKRRPVLIDDSETIFFQLGVTCLFTSVIFLAASMCGCSYQYTLITHRKGSKGACGLLHKMLCPCLHKRSERSSKFGHGLYSESDSQDDSDDYRDGYE